MDYMKLVHEIERLYPSERLERSRARLRAVWSLQMPADRLPFVFNGVPAADPNLRFDPWDGLYSDEESLRLQLETIIDRAFLADDYIPSLYPGCRPGLISTAYGGREVMGGGHPWPEPILRDAQDVYVLEHPDLSRQGLAAEILERVRYFRRATQDRIAIQLADMQGPLDLASLFWSTENLLLAMIDTPAAVHHLLAHLTEDFIRYIRLLQQAAGELLVPFHPEPQVWMPLGRGISVSEDLLAVISPRLYPTFARPYNERIADEFGAIVVHSCGSVEHNLAVLAPTRGLIGVNFNNSETSLERVVEAVGGKAVIIMGQSGISIHGLPLLSQKEYLRFCLPLFKRRRAPAIIMLEAGSREQALELVSLADEASRL